MSSAKGITPVIAVILLLLITISMVGFAFVWFSRVTLLAQNATETRLGNVINQQEQTVRIDNVAGTEVTIRATGAQSIPVSGLQVYVNGAQQTCSSWSGTTLAPGSTITCTLSGACPSGARLRVTSPGNLDETICP
jgi:flagellin-like protein